MKPPAEATVQMASAWYARQSMLMGKLDKVFTPVQYSSEHDKILFVEARLGEGWEKLVVELKAMHGDGLDADPDAGTLRAEFAQALLNAVTCYERVATGYTTEFPEVAERNAEAVTNAQARLATLKAMQAK